AVGATGASPDQHERAHKTRLRNCESQRHISTHRQSDNPGPASVEDVRSVLRELVDPVWLVRHGRAAGAARVESNRQEAAGENRDLLAPRPQRLAESLEPQQRLALPVRLDVETLP